MIVIYVRCGHKGLPAPVRTHWIGLDWIGFLVIYIVVNVSCACWSSTHSFFASRVWCKRVSQSYCNRVVIVSRRWSRRNGIADRKRTEIFGSAHLRQLWVGDRRTAAATRGRRRARNVDKTAQLSWSHMPDTSRHSTIQSRRISKRGMDLFVECSCQSPRLASTARVGERATERRRRQKTAHTDVTTPAPARVGFCHARKIWFRRPDCQRMENIFSDHFNGSITSVGLVCGGVDVRIITSELNYLWPRYLARWFSLTMSRSSSKFKVISQSSQSREERKAQQLLEWPTVA